MRWRLRSLTVECGSQCRFASVGKLQQSIETNLQDCFRNGSSLSQQCHSPISIYYHFTLLAAVAATAACVDSCASYLHYRWQIHLNSVSLWTNLLNFASRFIIAIELLPYLQSQQSCEAFSQWCCAYCGSTASISTSCHLHSGFFWSRLLYGFECHWRLVSVFAMGCCSCQGALQTWFPVQ